MEKEPRTDNDTWENKVMILKIKKRDKAKEYAGQERKMTQLGGGYRSVGS